MKVKFLVSFLIFFFSKDQEVLATSISWNSNHYYVSSSYKGKISNGTIPFPWKSLTEVQKNMIFFLPGDYISFKRGDTFPGILNIACSGTASQPIIFKSYGIGVSPVFNGVGGVIKHLFYVYRRSYIKIQDFRIIDIKLMSDKGRENISNIQRAITLEGSFHCEIRNCNISLVGTGIFLSNGGDHIIERNAISNLRMIINSNDGNLPGKNDDYGANCITLCSSNNKIKNNHFIGAWAKSYDYVFDGGAIELYDLGEGVNKNIITANYIFDCNGVMEVQGKCDDNYFDNNICKNNGAIVYCHNSIKGWRFQNNMFEESQFPRVSENYLFSASRNTLSELFLNNNTFNISIKVVLVDTVSFNLFQHHRNSYKLVMNSSAGYDIRKE